MVIAGGIINIAEKLNQYAPAVAGKRARGDRGHVAAYLRGFRGAQSHPLAAARALAHRRLAEDEDE